MSSYIDDKVSELEDNLSLLGCYFDRERFDRIFELVTKQYQEWGVIEPTPEEQV